MHIEAIPPSVVPAVSTAVTQGVAPVPAEQRVFASRSQDVDTNIVATALPGTQPTTAAQSAPASSNAPGPTLPAVAVPAATVTGQGTPAQSNVIRATRAPEGRARTDWPVFRLVQRLASAATSAEPAAIQVLRKLSPQQLEPALVSLKALPSTSAGQPLAEPVRRPMEQLLRRDLTGVRVHTAPAAALLGAEAFTTGEQIVFAPGHMDFKTTKGLALLGHELSHLGQPLAFKQLAGSTPVVEDAEERAARQQETQVRHIIEHGWPQESRMEVKRTPAPVPPTSIAPQAESTIQRSSATAGLNFIRGEAPDTVQRQFTEEQSLPVGQLRVTPSEGGTKVSGTAKPPDVDALARQVYAILKTRLRAERERYQFYPR